MYKRKYEKLSVMKKSGKSFIKMSSYSGGWSPETYLVNGNTPDKGKGDPNWAVVEGEVTKVERKVTPSRKLVKYELYDKYKEITKLDHEKPADAFERDEDGYLYGENYEFYKPVYDSPEPYYEEIEFEVIDRDCEPRRIPHYVKIKFPNNVDKYPETQHKYPCSISFKNVFDIIYDRVAEVVDNSNGKYVRDKYKNIQTLRVHEVIELPKQKAKHTPKSGKQKHLVFHIKGDYRNDSSAQRIHGLEGDNLDDLMAKLEAYIQTFLAQLDDNKRHVCDKCNGVGIVEEGAK